MTLRGLIFFFISNGHIINCRYWCPMPHQNRLLFFVFFLLLTLISANAAQVTSNGDEGDGSLRQIVTDSEEGDTITFSDSFTITLASPITIDKNIEIDGGDKVTISGGETTSIFKINAAKRHVIYDGYVYRTLLEADINGRTQYGITEQTAAPMPDGFEVAPDSEDIVQNVIAPYYWDIWRLCTENKCWATKNYGASAGVVKDNLRNWEQVENGDYRVKPGNDYYRLLIRANISQVPESGVVIKNITLKDGLAKGGNGERAGQSNGGLADSPGGGGAGMGGAIAIWTGAVEINGVTFINNKAIGGNGGASPPIRTSNNYGGAGGSSVFGGGAARKYWGSGRSNNGGFGGGGSGNNGYNDTAITRAGGNGGFGGGGGGGEASYDIVFPQRSRDPGGNGGIGGMFAGNGSKGGLGNAPTFWNRGYDPAPGTGGGGAGLGGAIFVKAGNLTVRNSSFESSEAQGGLGGTGAHAKISNGEPGQGVGGAIFVYQGAIISISGNEFSNTSSSFSDITDNDIYIMTDGEVGQGISFGTDTFTSVSSANEDVPITIADSAFTSVAATENGNFQGIIIESLPNNSNLELNGASLTVGEVIEIGDLSKILFRPHSNWPNGHGSDVSSWKFSGIYSRESSAGVSYMYAVQGNTFNITVSAVNDIPTLTGNNSSSVNEDSSVVLSKSLFSSKYRDVDGDSFTGINILSLPENGVLKLDDNLVSLGQKIGSADLDSSSLVFIPNPNFPSPATSEKVSFNWSANNDFNETTSERTLTITVKDTADPPVILDDVASSNGGVPVIIDVLANDTDPLGPRSPSTHPGSYTIEIVEAPAHGSVVIEGQKLTYLADNIEGPVIIGYRVNNGVNSNIANVTVNVAYNEFFGKAVVDKLGDENDGSTQVGDVTLREAISLVGTTNITGLIFADNLNNETINLDSGLGPLVIDKDIVIDGGDKLTISGGEATSIFKITRGNVKIRNITLKDGLAKGGNGERAGQSNGGLADSPGGGGAGMGGAIAIWTGAVEINGVTFINNKAIGGNGGASPPIRTSNNYGGAGGSSVFGGGAARKYWGSGRSNNGGFGGGGSGNNGYNDTAITRAGGNGGFGGGGGGGEASYDIVFPQRSRDPGGNGGIGGMFAGNGSKGGLGNAPTFWNRGYDPAPGTGGGGAGLGGAIFVKAGNLTVRNSSFESSEAQGGLGGTGAHAKISNGEPGQGVGGAIFVYQDAVYNSYGGVSYSGNSAQTIDDKYYIMEGGEYDTAPPVVTGTFNGELNEKNEGEESTVSGTISISDADADDNPQFEDIEIEDNYGSFSLANGNWIYSLDQSKVQGLSQGDLISNIIKLSATDGTEQTITIKINGSNDAPTPQVAALSIIEDDAIKSGLLISNDSDGTWYLTNNYEISLNDGSEMNVYVENDGESSWLLVGRGREGWEFDVDGQGDIESVADRSILGTKDAFSPSMYPDALINEFISRSGSDLTDVEIRLKRAGNPLGSSYQEVRWRPKTQTTWRSNFDVEFNVEKEIVAIGAATGDRVLTEPDSNTRNKYTANDATRVFTWAWSGHNNIKGFSYGSLVSNGANNPTSFLWEFSNENHAIPYTEVYIRLKDSGKSLITNLLKGGSDSLEYKLTEGVAGLELATDGTFTFDPSNPSYQSLAEGEVEELIAEWTVTDKAGASAQSTLTILVTGKNDSPASVAASGETVEDGDVLNGQLVANDPDNNSTFTYALTDAVPGLTINEDGSYSFDSSVDTYQSLKSGEVKELIANWKATDNNGAEASGILTLKVTGSNLVATPASGNAMEDGVSTSGQLIATDDNDANLKFSLVSDVVGLTLNTDGRWTFEATDEAYQSIALGKTRDVIANWKVEDESLGDSVTSTLTIAVTGANDNPVAVSATNEASAELIETVSDPNTFDLVWENENDPNDKLNMMIEFPAGSIGSAPDITFTSIAGSSLSIISGEVKTYADPRIVFRSNGDELDYSRELIGQAGFGPGQGGDFNLFDVGGYDGSTSFTVRSPDGDLYILKSMKARTVQEVDPNTFDLVWENENDPNDKLNMMIEFPAGSIGSAPDITFTSIAGSSLSIISGEVKTYADPRIVFRSNGDELDYSRELIGQAGFGPGQGGDFNLFDVGGYDGSTSFTVRSPDGDLYILKSMKARTVQEVDPNTFDLVWENENDPNDKLNMMIEFPAGSIGSAPDITFTSIAGSSLSIISGEVKTYADPRIVFRSNGDELDYSRELIGQAGFGPGQGGDFNLFDVGGYDGSTSFTVRSPDGDLYILKSMKARVTGGKVAQKVTGQLVASDSDDDAQLKFNLDEPLPGLTLNEDGSYVFDPSDEAYQFLPKSTNIDVVANWTVIDEYEASASSALTISVTGSSDNALTSITANEDDEIISGQVEDPDSGSNYVLVEELAGLTLNVDGSYAFDPSDAAYQSLAKDQKRELFVVWKAEGEGDTVINGIFLLVLTGVQDIAALIDASVNLTEGDQIIAGNGKLEIVDADAGQSSVIAQVNSEGDYGTFSIGIDGSWTYTSSGTQDALNDSKQVTDSFQVSSLDGSKTATVTVTITGTNDTAEVSSAAVELTESDEVLNASGSLAITDLDQGEDRFVEQADTSGNYGTFSIDSEGSWSFVSQSALNPLTEGQEVSESFEVESVDGTATATVTLKIIGTNDVAVVDSASVALNESDEVLNASGKLEFSDADEGQTGIKEQTDVAGNFGTFTISLDGNWSYTGNEEAISRIAKDQVVEDSFNVVSSDNSTTSPIKIEITGENDAPVAAPANTEAYAGTGLPSDGSTSFDLLWINEEDPSETISMNMKFAQDTLSNPPDIGFEGLLGSVLTINYQGETTVHNQPNIIFRAQENLDYSQELIGQPGFGPEEGGDFNLFSIEVDEGGFNGFGPFKVRAPDGLRYVLASMKPAGSASPPDGNKSFDLLWGNEEDPSETISMNMKFAQDTLSNPPDIGFEGLLGSVLTINYQGETTVHNQPNIIFRAQENLDYSQELIGQPGFGPEEGGDFNLFSIEVDEGGFNGFGPFKVRAPDGLRYVLASMKPVQSSGVSGQLVANDVDNNAKLKFSIDEPILGLTLNEDGSYFFDGSDEVYKLLWEGKSVELIAEWTVTDEHGSSDSSTLAITVKGTGEKPADSEPPVIAIIGDAELFLEASLEGTYTDSGATCQDGIDGNISESVEVSGDVVNLSKPGSYVIKYNCQDLSGNKAVEVTRTVIVADTLPPVITLNGSTEVTVEAGAVYNDAGVSASDSFDDAPIVEVVNGVKTGELGQYIVSYTVKDSSGNKSTQQRTVNVVDTLPPEITLNGSAEVTVEAGTAYSDAGVSASDSFDDAPIVEVVNGVKTGDLGQYIVSYTVKDSSGNENTQQRTVNVVDTLPPVITLNGSAEVTVEAGTAYSDAGVSASDSFDDAPIVEVVNGVKTGELGQYIVSYTVKDSSGNKSTQQRTVNVVDTLPPEITLNGSAEVTVEAGTAYSDAGVSASDSFDDAPIVEVVNGVKTGELGQYIVSYTVKDSSGNKSTQQRTVNVVDTLPPEITLNGSAEVTIEAGTVYADAGATAKDTLDGNVAVIVNNTVNTNEPGAYTVEYSAKDEAGNSDSAIRTVLVVDNTPPEIVLVGSATETIEATLEGNYVDDGATCQDGIEGNISQNVEVSGDVVNLSKPGSYVIRYKCQDSAGNQADQVTRTVIVQDTLPPEITMNGSTEVTIEAGTVYADAGATAKDTLDGNVAVIVNNTVNTNEPGAYTVEYSTKDEAGNSVTTSRQVNVTGITAAPKIVSVVANKEQGKIKSLAITFNSSSGESYHLMHSKDLVNWDILLEVNGDKDFTEVVIEDLVSDNKSMFYKVKLLQK